MGVRPEHLNDDPEVVQKSNSVLDAKIEVYELLGAEVFLYFTINGSNMTARVNPKTDARTGSEVKFAIDVDKVHVFDKETELTITN
jgi:multiple sugar transport system ATP-binding protein